MNKCKTCFGDGGDGEFGGFLYVEVPYHNILRLTLYVLIKKIRSSKRNTTHRPTLIMITIFGGSLPKSTNLLSTIF